MTGPGLELEPLDPAAGLGRADYRTVDRVAPLRALAARRGTTVERLVRDSSTGHGLWSLAVLRETLADFRTWNYPVLAYAVAGDEWLADLTLRSYVAYR